ncbi:MAG: GntR family transcriptional regulator [Oscillospiraceae bacterium]|nr:GntR family transcriptional regulator [Oscillospiraceae bacterium]
MFDIDLMSRIPIYEQLYRKVIELILKGVLSEQDKLPSVRNLATQLGVNPNTIAKTYSLLERDGIIYSLAGRGSFIAKPDKTLAQERVLQDFDNAVIHALDIGMPEKTLTDRISAISEKNQKGETQS